MRIRIWDCGSYDTNTLPELTMTVLSHTDLTTSHKTDFVAELIARQGEYGAISDIAAAYGVSRPTAYAAKRDAEAVLAKYYDSVSVYGLAATIDVDRAHIERFVVAHYVAGHNSIRDIEELLPLSFPGVSLGYGSIQRILQKANEQAARFNARVDLSGIVAGALDEMFSQGAPVLAGVCLDTGYIFGLALESRRDAKTWQAFLERAKEQGLDLKVTVKDAASGIARGVTGAFPGAEQRDDAFHAIYEMGKVLYRLERRAYAAIKKQMDAVKADRRARNRSYKTVDEGHRARLSAVGKKSGATKRQDEAIQRYDTFRETMLQVVEAMQWINLETAELNDGTHAEQLIISAAETMISLGTRQTKQVGTYIKNRAPGLVLYTKELHRHFVRLADDFNMDVVRIAVLAARLRDDLEKERLPWRIRHTRRELDAARLMLLRRLTHQEYDLLTKAVDQIIIRRHRASSVIEGFNAALRPFLYLHKGVTQGFLELFRAYHNLKRRRWGRHKHTSAHQCLVGEVVEDWLTMIGFSPSLPQYANSTGLLH